ncbi:MAG: alpha-L-rhamnosidase N-terminal domain-containing protein, partial [Deinococcota bacterium]|nr:alpha-L-rhamnosidase N-terminal domain-containing protein [Deinococcota bacterium]
MDQVMDWRAQWIWADGEASPRNAWRCFRRAFEAPLGWDGARLAITADSRYVLYLNGVRLGRGPARSWPFLQSFDLYEVGHLLKPGRANVLAVLVMHYGVSSFQYLRGRGGLLAQLELTHAAKVTTVVTDSSWKSALHAGHDPRSPRMSVQLGFAERVDARLWDDAWQGPDYDDSAWARAEAVGPVGTPPWTELTPRDIPHLSEEPLYPSRVVSLRAVKPLATTATIDICAQMMPDSVNHSNAVRYAGYLATVLRLPQSARLTLGSALATTSVCGACFVNGAPIDPTRWTGTDPERYLTLELTAGDNLLLIETTGDDRSGVGLHLGIDSEEAFELVSPLGEGSSSPFVTLGPFDELMVIDHQPSRALVSDHPAYRQAAAACSSEELLALREWLRPVPTSLVSQD